MTSYLSIIDTKNPDISLKANVPTRMFIKYSSSHCIFGFWKSNDKPPTVNSGVPEYPKNLLILPTAANPYSQTGPKIT